MSATQDQIAPADPATSAKAAHIAHTDRAAVMALPAAHTDRAAGRAPPAGRRGRAVATGPRVVAPAPLPQRSGQTAAAPVVHTAARRDRAAATEPWAVGSAQ